MIEQLFGSKTRFKLLRVFFRQPDGAFFVRQLARILDTQINAVRRELQLLIKLGLLREEKKKKVDSEEQGSSLRKYYSLDQQSLLYPELRNLLLKAQILGEQEFVKKVQEKGGEIKLLLVTGKFVGNPEVQSDLLLVGRLKAKTVARLISKYEKELGFEIRYTLMTEKEFRNRRHVMDKFLYALFEAENHKVVNKLNI